MHPEDATEKADAPADPTPRAQSANETFGPRPSAPEARHPWRHAPETVAPPAPPPGQFTGGSKNVFTAFTLFLCAVAVVFEATAHPAATILQLDPIPNVGVLALYVLTVAMLGLNHAVLTGGDGSRFAPWRESPRALGLLIVGTVVSLMVALSASFMFLPLWWLGALLILFAGLGLLLWTPYFALIALATQLRGLTRAWRAAGADGGEIRRTVGAASLAAGGLFAWLIGIPVAAAYYAERALRSDDPENFAMLRRLNSEGVLLDLAYSRKPNYWTCLGFNARENGWWPTTGMSPFYADRAAARRAYFLTTGKPFEQAPRPMSYTNNSGGRVGADDVAREETGGFFVGRKVPGLWLAESRTEATTDSAAGTGRVDWTLTFRNDNDDPQEARADILLPNDAAVSSVSLWINGVEQPARYGHPDRVRAAYQEVAVVQRRDPLLVTMPAPGHVLAQCFPVPARGTMKIKLGFTGTLRPDRDNPFTKENPALRLELPALGMVNFDVPGDLKPTRALNGQAIVGDSPHRADEARDLFLVRSVAVAPRGPRPVPAAPLRVVVVVDASEGMAPEFRDPSLDSWNDAFRGLPDGSTVDLMFSDAPEKTLRWQEPLRWSDDPAARARMTERQNFLSRRFVGGVDPRPALVRALRMAREDATKPGLVLFVHAASPHGVSDPEPLRRELQKDYWNGPALVGVPVAPEVPDALIKDLSGFPRVFTARVGARLPQPGGGYGDAFYEAARLAQPPAGDARTVAEGFLKATDSAPAAVPPTTGTDAARVSLFRDVLTAWRYANTLPEARALDLRIAAGKAAARSRLVTPLSSAVVLETKEQYEKHGLEDDEKSDRDGKKSDKAKKPADLQNPALPEPGTLALVALGLLALGKVVLSGRRS